MGCGCRERKEAIARKMEEWGQRRMASMVRRIPSPGGANNRDDHASERWSMHDLPMSGKTSIGGPQDRERSA